MRQRGVADTLYNWYQAWIWLKSVCWALSWALLFLVVFVKSLKLARKAVLIKQSNDRSVSLWDWKHFHNMK